MATIHLGRPTRHSHRKTTSGDPGKTKCSLRRSSSSECDELRRNFFEDSETICKAALPQPDAIFDITNSGHTSLNVTMTPAEKERSVSRSGTPAASKSTHYIEPSNEKRSVFRPSTSGSRPTSENTSHPSSTGTQRLTAADGTLLAHADSSHNASRPARGSRDDNYPSRNPSRPARGSWEQDRGYLHGQSLRDDNDDRNSHCRNDNHDDRRRTDTRDIRSYNDDDHAARGHQRDRDGNYYTPKGRQSAIHPPERYSRGYPDRWISRERR
jgi:hypothetical protein